MRICLIHPNYHSGGAEIAGNWPPAWVAYIAGALKSAGYDDIHFIDAMTDHVTPEQLRVKLAEIQPDVVGTTAITPSIYVAEETLKIAAEVVPGALRILGGIHATFMYQQVLSEAPHIDVIVRGEGEEIIVDLIRAYDTGRWPEGRAAIKVVDEIEKLVNEHGVGFFILADEEPTINRRKFIQFCEELIRRDLPRLVQWGINTRVTDIYRDRELLSFYRSAGLVHISLGTEAAAQLKLDQFNKETKVEENKEAIRLLREADIFTEAQFIVGLDNETPETLEETYRMAWDWQPDLANWAMYTPWPFTPLFQELGDKVEIFDFSKYNFVTPIMRPAAMDRDELLDRVMNNYRRFYMKKALFHYPWRGTGYRRRYLLGCLKAFLKAGFARQFYDLGKVDYWGPQSKGKLNFNFDRTRTIAPAQMADWQSKQDIAAQKRAAKLSRTEGFVLPNGAKVKAAEKLPAE